MYISWVVLYGTPYVNSTTKPFLKKMKNRVMRNLVHTKLKKGLEMVTNLETFFRFRVTPFFFQCSLSPNVYMNISIQNQIIGRIVFKVKLRNIFFKDKYLYIFLQLFH